MSCSLCLYISTIFAIKKKQCECSTTHSKVCTLSSPKEYILQGHSISRAEVESNELHLLALL